MKLVRNSLYSLLGVALPIVVSVGTVPLYIGKIGEERYGALAIAWLLLGYFGQADFGIGRAITQRISSMTNASRADMADVVWSAIASIAVFGVIGGGLVYLSANYFFAGPFKVEPGLRAELMNSVWALALCNPLVALIGVTSGALIGLERFKLVSAANLVSNTSLQLFPLAAAYLFGTNLEYLIVAALIGRFSGLLMLSWGVWRTFLSGERALPSFAEVKRLSNFGVWIMVSALISPLMIFADRFIIGSVEGAAAVAIYSIPFSVASRTQILPIAVIQALFPRFAAEDSEVSRGTCQQFSIFLGQMFAPITIGIICLSDPLMRLWLGHRLNPASITIAQVILAGFWINALANVPFAFIQARGNPRFTALLHCCELPVYLALLYGLGSKFGLPGIAAAFSLRCAIDCIALMRKAGIGNWRTLTNLAGPVGLIIVAIFIANMVHGWAASMAAAMVLGVTATGVGLLQMPPPIRARLAAMPFARFVPGLRSAKPV